MQDRCEAISKNWQPVNTFIVTFQSCINLQFCMFSKVGVLLVRPRGANTIDTK